MHTRFSWSYKTKPKVNEKHHGISARRFMQFSVACARPLHTVSQSVALVHTVGLTQRCHGPAPRITRCLRSERWEGDGSDITAGPVVRPETRGGGRMTNYSECHTDGFYFVFTSCQRRSWEFTTSDAKPISLSLGKVSKVV